MNKIVHLGRNGLIMNKFVEFMEENFDNKKHIYFLTGQNVNGNKNVIDIKNIFDFIKNIFYLNFQLYKTKKIIIHSFDQTYMFFILLFQPWLIKKVYWAMWGWDLYSYKYPILDFKTKVIQKIKKIIFPKIRHFITYIEGDYELAKKWYNIKDTNYYECIMYPSNLYKEYCNINIDYNQKSHNHTLNIQIGHNASASNNHLYIFQKLEYFKDDNIKIFLPLSYGKNDNLNEIIKRAKNIFGKKITFLNDILSLDEYISFQNSIDIAVFAHDEQQAMGNIISLLGFGKKVYMRKSITPFKFFEKIGVKVYNVEDVVNIDLIEEQIKKDNQQKIKNYFSKENYIKQLKNIFES